VAKGPYYPRIDGVATGGREKILVVPGTTEAFNAVQITANLQWELDFWGRLRRNSQAARAEYLASADGAQVRHPHAGERRGHGLSAAARARSRSRDLPAHARVGAS